MVGFRNEPFLKEVVELVLSACATALSIDEAPGEKNALLKFEIYSQSNSKSRRVVDFGRKDSASLSAIRMAPIASTLVESWYFRALDRVYLDPLSMSARERNLLDDSIAWLSALDGIEGEKIAIFAETPHFPRDIALFGALKAMGFSAYALRRTGFDDLVYFDELVAENLPFRYPTSLASGQIRETVMEEKPSAIFWDRHLNNLNIAALRRPSLKKPLFLIKYLLRAALFVVTNPFKYLGRNRIKLLGAVIASLINQARCASWLDSESAHFQIPEEKYIYFPLHRQPEATTIPEAGEYWYHAKAIMVLATAIPEDWSVVIKEHPTQVGMMFRPDPRTTSFRTVEDYKLLTRIPKVIFAPTAFSSADLIANSSIVASLNGSAGWEALSIGKPAIVFSPTWYSHFSGCVYIEEESDVASAIVALAELDKDSILDSAKETVQHVAQSAILSSKYDAAALGSSIDRAELVSNLANAILDLRSPRLASTAQEN